MEGWKEGRIPRRAGGLFSAASRDCWRSLQCLIVKLFVSRKIKFLFKIVFDRMLVLDSRLATTPAEAQIGRADEQASRGDPYA